MKIYGLDISLDHGGAVVLNNGVISNYCYLTTTKKMAEIDPNHSILLSKRGKDESKETFRLRRMNEYLYGLMNFERKSRKRFGPIKHSYYSIEGYSYASQSTSICQIAELTGYLKHMIFEGGGHIRIHDPLTVKLFATNKGNASKKEVVVSALHNFDVPEGLITKKTIKKKGKTKFHPDQWWEDYDGPVTDIADAYFLARMVYVELKLRSGEVTLDKLSENERRIFLRVTPAYPVNILDRPFIKRKDGKNANS